MATRKTVTVKAGAPTAAEKRKLTKVTMFVALNEGVNEQDAVDGLAQALKPIAAGGYVKIEIPARSVTFD
jgi:hypothetical protein